MLILDTYNMIETQFPSHVAYNHYGLCLRAARDLPKGTAVATGDLEKTDKPYLAGHDCPEYKYVALMDVLDDGTPVWGKVRGKWAFCNHSCDSNCDVNEIWNIVTNRAVAKGEELTTSYDAYVPNFRWPETWNFVCLCAQPNCKKIIKEYRQDLIHPPFKYKMLAQ